jgi:hypothetical protein
MAEELLHLDAHETIRLVHETADELEVEATAEWFRAVDRLGISLALAGFPGGAVGGGAGLRGPGHAGLDLWACRCATGSRRWGS